MTLPAGIQGPAVIFGAVFRDVPGPPGGWRLHAPGPPVPGPPLAFPQRPPRPCRACNGTGVLLAPACIEGEYLDAPCACEDGQRWATP